jgi:hypothetical protein
MRDGSHVQSTSVEEVDDVIDDRPVINRIGVDPNAEGIGSQEEESIHAGT